MISSRHLRRDSLLFVYGTLRPFFAIEVARWLQEQARYLGPATARGRLYDLGAYPGMQTARGRREHVRGDVYRVTNPRVLRVLDRYEAGGERGKPRFVRERCVVKLDRRRRLAWLYRYRYSVVGAARIASGDYRFALSNARAVTDAPRVAVMSTVAVSRRRCGRAAQRVATRAG